MSTRTTKAQLQNEVERLREECNRLETLVASMRATAPAPAAPRPNVKRVPYTPRELPAHFIAAREAAMRMGRSVKVEA